MSYGYGGYGQGWSPVPDALGGLGQVFSNIAQSAYQWLPLVAGLMQAQEQAGRESLKLAWQSSDPEVRRRASETYMNRFSKSPFALELQKMPGQITTPGQAAITAPATVADAQVPGAGLDVLSQQGAQRLAGLPPQTIQPAVAEVRAPGQFYSPPVALGDRTVSDVLAGNPALTGLPDAIKNARWVDLPPEMQAELGKYFTAPFVWGGLGGSTTPTPGVPAPATPPASATGVAPAPGQPPGPPAGTVPARPQPSAQPGVPGQPSAARVNPAIVEGARGKNIGQLSAAEVLESRGVPLTPQEETELSAIPITNFANPLQLETFLNQRRTQAAQIRAETATAGLREAETTGAQATQAAQAAQRQQDYYTNAAFGIMFGDPKNAPARLTQLYAQAEAHGVKPAIVKADAMERLQRAQAGETVPIQLHDSRGTPYRNPDGTPVTVRMTGNEYRQYLQENERTRLLHSAESLNRIKFEMIDRARKQFGDDTMTWPDDIRVLMGFEPKPTSPQAIRKWAIDLLTRNDPFFNTPNKDETPEQLLARQLREVDNLIKIYAPPKPGSPEPAPGGPGPAGAPGAKPSPAPLDPKIAAIVKDLQGPIPRIAGDVGAWFQRTFGSVPPTPTPVDASRLASLARVWPTLTPAQRTQLRDAVKIPAPWMAWLDKNAGGTPAATPPAPVPGAVQPGRGPAKPGAGRQVTMAVVRQQAAERGISVAAALAQAKEDGYVIVP